MAAQNAKVWSRLLVVTCIFLAMASQISAGEGTPELQGVFRMHLDASKSTYALGDSMKLPGFRGHFPLCGEGSTNGQETSSCLSLGVPG